MPQKKNRTTSITLSDETVKKIAEDLGIKNLDRIPREMRFSAVEATATFNNTAMHGISVGDGVLRIDLSP